MILHDRKLEIADQLELTTENIETLPDFAIEMMAEKRKRKMDEQEKEYKIQEVEDEFKQFRQKRVLDLIERRKKKGL